MDQIKIGAFLKALRRGKALTQEQLAEQLGVSGRTVSRWETGSNMPDLGMLVELAEFYGVSIPEIIKGERKSENMDQKIKETRRVIGILLSVFGLFIIISALSVFPGESSWGGIYATFGSLVMLAGLYLIIRPLAAKCTTRIGIILAAALLLFGVFTLSDYLAVTQFNQVPRFRIATRYDSRTPDQLVYQTLFFTAVQQNPGTPDAQITIVK